MVNRSNRNSKYAFNKNKTSKMVSDSRKFNQNGVKKRLGNSAKGTIKPHGVIKDARQKIKAKQQRKNVVDARDILAKMAKTQDARGKIQKMRENTYNSTKTAQHIRPIGANIIRRTDANGKICLLTNKSKPPANNMNLAIQQQLGILPHPTSRMLPKKPSYPVIKKMPHSLSRTPTMRHPISQQPAPTVIRKTIHNNYTSAPPPTIHHITSPAAYHMDMDSIYANGSNLFKWHRKEPTVMPMMRGSAMISDPTSGNWITYAPPMSNNFRSVPMPSTTYTIDVDDPMDVEDLQPQHMSVRPQRNSSNSSSNVHSRLDGSPESPPPLNTHGILSQTKTKVVVPVGHRIVVSNLQGTVTQDDIRELFEDIGQLLVARLVRPGTAEVIYKNLKDAQKAVDTYHNRQLDGQPMKCLLVNKRPSNNPTAPAISSPLVRKIPSVNAANKLVPDLSTIHKVLFQRN